MQFLTPPPPRSSSSSVFPFFLCLVSLNDANGGDGGGVIATNGGDSSCFPPWALHSLAPLPQWHHHSKRIPFPFMLRHTSIVVGEDLVNIWGLAMVQEGLTLPENLPSRDRIQQHLTQQDWCRATLATSPPPDLYLATACPLLRQDHTQDLFLIFRFCCCC